jgi:hypothetical protein
MFQTSTPDRGRGGIHVGLFNKEYIIFTFKGIVQQILSGVDTMLK